MKHIKKFEKYNENYRDFGKKLNRLSQDWAGDGFIKTGAAFLLCGIYYGYSKVEDFLDFRSFKNAFEKISPIYSKIMDDSEMRSIIVGLRRSVGVTGVEEEGGYAQEGSEYFNLLNDLYKRAEEILSEEEFNVFVSSAEEIDRAKGRKGSFFVDKDREGDAFRNKHMDKHMKNWRDPKSSGMPEETGDGKPAGY